MQGPIVTIRMFTVSVKEFLEKPLGAAIMALV